jgi:hypothetical protein
MKYLLDTGPLVALLDAKDFAVYRRFGREGIPHISPPRV